MDALDPQFDVTKFAWRLGVTLFFVGVNGFFVAAEFALVKVRGMQLSRAAEAGSRGARVAVHIHRHLDRYLSACQLGITIASLILGWLAEPAVAELLLAGVAASGWQVDPASPILHGFALAIALTIVTLLHMTIGEQAPKVFAIRRPERVAIAVSRPLRVFEIVFRPMIWAVNEISNGIVRMAGVSLTELGEGIHDVDEIRTILASSAEAGHISGRQVELARNVLSIIGLEVRHILVPRVDVAYLSLQATLEANLETLRRSGHSRLPLCEVGLDTVVGIVHVRDVMTALLDKATVDLTKLARKPLFVPDTQPLSRLIGRMQETRNHCAVVLDEHGTAVGLAFLEDALEEIVGPIRDEFDETGPEIVHQPDGTIHLPGSMALPEAAEILGLSDLEEEADTIAGYVVAALGRLPRKDDSVDLGKYTVFVEEVVRQRVTKLRFTPVGAAAVGDAEAVPVGVPSPTRPR